MATNALHRWSPARDDLPRVYVFPHAGAGVASFAALAEAAGDRLEIVALRFPGRESRFVDPFYGSLAGAADEMAGVVAADLVDHPTRGERLLLGQCSGTGVAVEMVQRLAASTTTAVAGLVVVSFPDPSSVPEASEDDPERYLEGAYDPELLANDQMKAVLVRILEADLHLLRGTELSYLALDVPVLAIRGSEDDAVSPESIEAWGRRTSGPFSMAELATGHFVAQEDPVGLASAVGGFADSIS